MPRRRVLCYGILVLGAFACDSGRPVTGLDTRLPAPALQMVGLPPFSTTLGIDNPYNPVNSVTLSTYPRYTLAKVSISGLTTATYIPTQQQTTLDARGRWANDVWNACYENVRISFTEVGTIDFGGCGSYTPEQTLTKHALLRGQGSAVSSPIT